MPAQPSWNTIQLTLKSAIITASGLGAGAVVWSWQNFNAPPQTYVRLALGAAITVGVDYIDEIPTPAWAALTHYAVGDLVFHDSLKIYQCITAGTSAGAGGPTGTGSNITDGTAHWKYLDASSFFALSICGVREVPLTIEVFTTAVVETDAAATALSLLDLIVTKLRLPTARDAFESVGVCPFGPGPSNYIPDVVSVGFRGRAVCDVRCRMPARAVTEYANFIASIAGVVNVEGMADGSTAVVPIAAP